jgi:Copper type II ascorbate-dependent monooxygenase, C-terminal domain
MNYSFPKIISATFILSVSFSSLFSQGINFTEHIAPIIHQNCTPCHRTGEAAPFSLITYEDVAKRGKFIQKVTQIRYMPPWRADHDFGEFKDVRKLTIGQIATIKLWVENGMPKGPEKELKLPDFQANSQLKVKPDLVLKMNKPFQIPKNNKEEYYLFSFPTNLQSDTYVKAIEFRAGNKKLVHHSRISIDTTQKMRVTDAKSIDDPSIAEFAKIRMKDEFWAGWVPGNNPIVYPDGIAKPLQVGSDLLINIHYAPNVLQNEIDSSSVNLYFAKEPIQQELRTLILFEKDITNQPFEIPADTVITFYAKSVEIPYPISILSVQPHMHLLGKSLRSYAITPGGDLIPLIKISTWDFDWQMTYQYKEAQVIPAGSYIFAEVTYDNTGRNPRNSFSPPQKITAGWNSTQEMFNLIFQYVIPK